jgi:hypothetical protein
MGDMTGSYLTDSCGGNTIDFLLLLIEGFFSLKKKTD